MFPSPTKLGVLRIFQSVKTSPNEKSIGPATQRRKPTIQGVTNRRP
jgi:hypothetical protein